MEPATKYKFSKGVRRAKRRYTLIAITLPPILIAFLFLSPMSKDLSPIAVASMGLVSFIFLGLIFYFSASRALRKLSELSVFISPDSLERQDVKQKEIFFWKDLLKAEIIDYPNGETAYIKLAFKNKKAIFLFGFEDMEAAIKQIGQYIPNNNLLRRKKAKINWDNPAVMILSSVLTVVIILAVQNIGEKLYSFSTATLFLAAGSYVLIARPISSSQGKGWEKFETIIGVFLIVGNIFLLVMELFSVLR